MRRPPLPLSFLAAALLAAAACRTAPRETASMDATRADSGTASNYSADSTGRPGARGVAGTHTGTELEAPPLIPSVQTDLRQLAAAPTPGNRTAHKNLLGDLVNAMQADLSRLGQPDTGRFKALSDSVLGDVGGGTGRASGPDTKDVQAHVDRVNRLISSYEAITSRATQ
jgi:hypothetical protein